MTKLLEESAYRVIPDITMAYVQKRALTPWRNSKLRRPILRHILNSFWGPPQMLLDLSGNGSGKDGTASWSFGDKFTPTGIRRPKARGPAQPGFGRTGCGGGSLIRCPARAGKVRMYEEVNEPSNAAATNA